jgi:hypothetical protein
MLLWQWKNAHKKAIIWGHLVVLVVVLHLFFGCVFFLWLHHGAQHIVLSMQPNVATIPVVFSRNHLPSRSTVHTIKKSGALQSKVPKKNTNSVHKTTLAKPAPLKKKNFKPVVPKKTSPKKEIKKTVPLKKEPVPKKIEASKKEIVQKVEEKLIPEVKKNIQEPIVQLPVVAQVVPLQAVVEEPQPAGELLGINQEDAELYALVAQQWRPPVGIAVAHECEVSAEIGWKQEITKVWIHKKSGVLMYDLAARKAVMQTTFPLWTRGKTVTIRFVQ